MLASGSLLQVLGETDKSTFYYKFVRLPLLLYKKAEWQNSILPNKPLSVLQNFVNVLSKCIFFISELVDVLDYFGCIGH